MPTLMTKAQTQASAKKLNRSLMNLSPTALITLFEIDIENLVTDRGINDILDTTLRFHNNVKLLDTSITWRGNQYTAAPIQAQGFELNGRGTLPTPKLAISVSSEGIFALAILKTRLRQLDDLIGAKVTRIRTYAENLDPLNFIGGQQEVDLSNYQYDPTIEAPELPRDIYYIDRKSAENKNLIEFELASILDVEGVKLPGRVVYANRCPAVYRCEGCLYEYAERFDAMTAAQRTKVFGDAARTDLYGNAIPVANDRDESIEDILNPTQGNIDPSIKTNLTAPAKDLTLYSEDILKSIGIGNVAFIIKNDIRYFFVCKALETNSASSFFNHPPVIPPDTRYWIADTCSKTIRGCKLRFKNGNLRFVGFPGCDRIK